ncbi:hypothetical protein COV13_00340 [Candidatus Woesearchaeota archaeon CG10_big_fil_rev_8_21_14_0_10_32_9]|nr:MAG: hypothetical protein COV13_00340 [Candidatus Woesearchaeota archaeon CG10_big_fil_rev_8_21_14_0_10_32_9]
MKKVLIRLPRATEDPDTGKKIILNKSEKYYVESDSDFNYNYGSIKAKTIKGSELRSGKDTFYVFDPVFLDNYKKIKRLAQIITLKDVGAIIANTGINRDSEVIDAGAGSGALSCFLAKIAKQVDSFDVEDKNLEVAKKNAKLLGIDNVTYAKGDVYNKEEFKNKNNTYDVFTLDVPEPWRALDSAYDVLKVGGYLVIYAPNITQIQETVLKLNKKMLHEKTIEIIEREWSVKDKVLRPVTKDFGHTAFLSFVRKIN